MEYPLWCEHACDCLLDFAQWRFAGVPTMYRVVRMCRAPSAHEFLDSSFVVRTDPLTLVVYTATHPASFVIRSECY